MSHKIAKKNRIKRELPPESINWTRAEKRRYQFARQKRVEISKLEE